MRPGGGHARPRRERLGQRTPLSAGTCSRKLSRPAVGFVRRFEEAAQELAPAQPGCLFVTFVYERELGEGGEELIREAIRTWRGRIHEKVEAAAASRPSARGVDLEALADHVFTTFEGGFILARAMGEPGHLRAQLAQLRRYLELLFEVPAQPASRLERAAAS